MIHSSLGHCLLAGSPSDLTNPVERNSEQTIHRVTENIRLVAQKLCCVTHTDPRQMQINSQMRYRSDSFISAPLLWVDPLSKGQAQKVLVLCSFCGVWKWTCVFLRVEGDKENIPSPGVRVTEEGDRHLLLPPHEAQRYRKPNHSPTLTEHSDNQDAPTVSVFFRLISMAFSFSSCKHHYY